MNKHECFDTGFMGYHELRVNFYLCPSVFIRGWKQL